MVEGVGSLDKRAGARRSGRLGHCVKLGKERCGVFYKISSSCKRANPNATERIVS